MVGDAYRGIAVNSARLAGPAIAIAAARAGGIGVLDIEETIDPATLRAMFDGMLAGTDGEVGLRLTPDHIPQVSDLVGLFADRAYCLILHGGTAASTNAAIAALPANRRRRLLVDVTDI